MATITFSGIYATTKSFDPSGFYGAETSRVAINTTPLATAATFTQPGTSFSGNNVLGTVSFGGTSFSALASRPIKVYGVLKGFYVWVDNEDIWSGNGTSLDTAFILSLDNTYFNATPQISSSSEKVATALGAVLESQTKTPIPNPDSPDSPEIPPDENGDFFDSGFPELFITVDDDIDPNEIDVIDPNSDPLDEESYRIEEIPDSDPEQTTYKIILEDSDPETPGDQPFGSIYEEFLDDEGRGNADDYQGDGDYQVITTGSTELELAEFIINSQAQPLSQRLACLQVLFSLDPPNSAEVDVITGPTRPNVYELGDSEKAFYAYRGDNDFAVIRNFKTSDTLQLHGNSADYTLSNPITVAGETGYGLRYQDELIALLQGSDAVLKNLQSNLSGDSFNYF